MAKIKRITVWGFYSYNEPQVLDLSEGLTVITGPTDAGKTTLLRAIRWVALGEPSGEDFIFTKRDEAGQIVYQAEEAGVHIEMDDGRYVKKTRRKSKTKYWVSGYQDPFEKAEVPDAVTDVLGIRKQNYSDFETALNFAYQLEAPFLISQTASAGAKVLAKLAGVEVVDGAIKSVSKDQYAARTQKTQADQAAEKAKESLKAYEDLDMVREQLEAAEVLLGQIEAEQNRAADIRGLDIQLQRSAHILSACQQTLDALADLPDLWEDVREIEKAQQRYDTLLDLFNQLGKATVTVDFLTQQLKSYKDLEFARFLLDDADKLAVTFTDLATLSKDYHRHAAYVQQASATLLETSNLGMAVGYITEAEHAAERLRQLQDVGQVYRIAQQKVQRITAAMEAVADLPVARQLIGEAEEGMSRLHGLLDLSSAYMRAVSVKNSAAINEARETQAINGAKAELAEIFATLTECPTCGQPVNGIAHLTH